MLIAIREHAMPLDDGALDKMIEAIGDAKARFNLKGGIECSILGEILISSAHKSA